MLCVPSPATLWGMRTHLGDLNASEKERERDRGERAEPGDWQSLGTLGPMVLWTHSLGGRSTCLL